MNNQVNWSELAKNEDFVYLKSSEGNDWIDPEFETNAQNAQSCGVKFGFYHFFRVHDIASSKYQADFFYDLIKKYNYSVIPAVDIEVTDSQEADYISACLDAFIVEFRQDAGYNPVVYSYTSFINEFLKYSVEAPKCELWIADYRGSQDLINVSLWNNWSAWQTGDNGTPYFIGNECVDQDVATSDIFMASSPLPIVQPVQTSTILSNEDIQTDLNKIGGYNLVVDGIIGNKSESAIRDFQNKHGLESDGICGVNTSAKILEVLNSVSNTSSNYDSNVLTVQQKLNKLHITDENGNSLLEDGISGNCTISAIKKFQSVCGIESDGVYGSQSENSYQQIIAQTTLRQGSTGIAVRYLQYRVNAYIDGVFGQGTADSTSNWQWDNGLYGDSIVGNLSWNQLLK